MLSLLFFISAFVCGLTMNKYGRAGDTLGVIAMSGLALCLIVAAIVS